jgi:hypothetical protein
MEKRNSFPHVQQFQYKEYAAFCQAFNGSLIILSNDTDAKLAESQWRMFELRGELSEESHLIEIGNLGGESLRSKTSFLFVNSNEKLFIVWHGCCSNQLQRGLILECAKKLSNRYKLTFFFQSYKLETYFLIAIIEIQNVLIFLRKM